MTTEDDGEVVRAILESLKNPLPAGAPDPESETSRGMRAKYAGQDAAWRGEPVSSCPHAPGDPMHAWWIKGFLRGAMQNRPSDAGVLRMPPERRTPLDLGLIRETEPDSANDYELFAEEFRKATDR